VLELCFSKQLADGWKGKLEQIIPSYGHSLIDDAALTHKVRADTAAVLGLQNV
jgi:malate dehydrogenase (quinone)